MSVQFGLGVGAELGGYRIEALLGRGGMSAVYRAADRRLGRQVALKVLSSELAEDEHFRARFLRESRLAASLDHPNIVPIYEAGEADGALYIAMRYVEGMDLRAVIRREGTLDAHRAVGLVAQLAAALDTAHAHGLVHRDVKPSNALVSAEEAHEHVYLADFGLIKHIYTRDPTTTGRFLGTVDYMAPEQIRGDAVDARADVYALGCVLFECLTGEVPFPRRSEVAAIYSQLEEQPPRPSERRPGLPRALDAVLWRALDKDPARRWPTAGELAAAARAALTEPAAAAEDRRARARTRRKRLAAIGLAATTAAAAIVVAIVGPARDGAAGPAEFETAAIVAFNPATGERTAAVPVGLAPSGVAAGFGALWATDTDSQSVLRIDPSAHSVTRRIHVDGGPSAIAAGSGAVWVVNSVAGSVTKIAPGSNRVVKTVQVGNGPNSICVSKDAVWVSTADDQTIVRIDSRTGRMRTIAVDTSPTELACAAKAVWASSSASGTVTQFNAATGEPIQPIDTGAGASGLALAGGYLWVANTLAGTLSKVDPGRGVIDTVRLGADDGPTKLASGADGLWVSNELAGTVARIDPQRAVAVRTVKVGNRPRNLALVDGSLWVGVHASAALHRGGTLRLVETNKRWRVNDFYPGDWLPFPAQILSITNDGLTAFRRTGSQAGAAVVPDLARSLPRPTDGGRTYFFQLRPGIHYSDDELVRPSDIRRSVERSVPAGIPFFLGISGAARCRGPHTCDLSGGIVTDDRAGTIAFHLAAPDPAFLFKLAQPSAVAVPPGSAANRAPPATGPYMFARRQPRSALKLVRNPRFRQWSSAAKPGGNVDAISVRFATSGTGARAVERGRADYVQTTLSDTHDLDAAFRRYPGQVHTSTQPLTTYIFLSPGVPPFDNVDVRRAVNLAVDRRALVSLLGGRRVAEPTCQNLPPNFPAYRPYCPDTANGRAWGRPRLAAARRLVARSHTRGMRVTVWSPSAPREPLVRARFITRVLKRLGYRASLHLVPPSSYFNIPWHSIQVSIFGFNADYPAASSILPTFRCGYPEPPLFCDRTADRMMNRARRLEAGNQTQANAIWAKVDRRLVDRGASVPVYNNKAVDFVSRRVGNYQHHPQWGILLDQLWVR